MVSANCYAFASFLIILQAANTINSTPENFTSNDKNSNEIDSNFDIDFDYQNHQTNLQKRDSETNFTQNKTSRGPDFDGDKTSSSEIHQQADGKLKTTYFTQNKTSKSPSTFTKIVEKRESNSKERRYDNSNEIIDEIEARRRSMLLDKNFMRFGRNSGKGPDQSSKSKIDLIRKLLNSNYGHKNFMDKSDMYDVLLNENTDDRFEDGVEDDFYDLPREIRGGGNSGFLRLGRSDHERESRNPNMMRFGRSDSLDRQGRNPNMMRFGRSDTIDREGRAQNMMRFGRSDALDRESRAQNMMRFGRADKYLDRDERIPQNMMRFGRSDFLERNARDKNMMRFGRSDTLNRASRVPQNMMRFGRSDHFERDMRTQSLMRFGRNDPGHTAGFIRFGRSLYPKDKYLVLLRHKDAEVENPVENLDKSDKTDKIAENESTESKQNEEVVSVPFYGKNQNDLSLKPTRHINNDSFMRLGRDPEISDFFSIRNQIFNQDDRFGTRTRFSKNME